LACQTAQLNIPSSFGAVRLDGQPLEIADLVDLRASKAQRHSVVDFEPWAGSAGQTGGRAGLVALEFGANGP
jgi:hypothetical protein